MTDHPVWGITDVYSATLPGLVFTPGLGLDFTMPAGTDVPAPPDQTLVEMMISMVPDNPIAAMAEGQILQLIIFALLFGIGFAGDGRRAG